MPACAGTTVEVWENYNVSIEVDSTTAHVTEELTIKNVIDKSVVPGYGYITLSKEESSDVLGISIPFTEKVQGMEISDVSARLDDGSVITDIMVTEEEEVTTIRYGFWTPVMPGQSRTIVIEYTTDDIVDKGILFDSITYMIQPSSIPIENAMVEADIDGKHVSYSSSPTQKTDDTMIWTMSDIDEDAWELNFEYGSLPLPNLPFKWSQTFFILIFGIIGIWSYRQWKFDK
ncbi:hypothetical protein ACT9XH_09450 [Methanococcoides methylutens]|uniref:hypothetical protein n=1 Tax=Methanococcoides methylutens TaxID=2226 RepID=UPI0040451868